jgi:hypothetical protein
MESGSIALGEDFGGAIMVSGKEQLQKNQTIL